jgi:L-seryl-tRNA(Ser) seleniumtransferase
MSSSEARARAQSWAEALGDGSVIESESTVGGGSLPGESLKTYVLALGVKSPDRFLKALRQCDPPVIARTEANRVLLDPRTILPGQDASLLQSLRSVLSR